MNLEIEEVKYHQVYYVNLDNFINHHFFGGEDKFEFCTDEEAHNYSYHAYNIDDKVDKYYRKKIDNGETYLMTRCYLCAACEMGLIPPGRYLISAIW